MTCWQCLPGAPLTNHWRAKQVACLSRCDHPTVPGGGRDFAAGAGDRTIQCQDKQATCFSLGAGGCERPCLTVPFLPQCSTITVALPTRWDSASCVEVNWKDVGLARAGVRAGKAPCRMSCAIAHRTCSQSFLRHAAALLCSTGRAVRCPARRELAVFERGSAMP